jgi:hypothetical protein
MMNSFVRVAIALIVFVIGSLTTSVVARQQQTDQHEPLAKRSDIYCTGYISETAPRTDLQVIGAEKENLKETFTQGDVVFLNRGRGAGIKPGAVYYIVRPVGELNHPFKKSKLGYYVRELGLLRVLEVADQVSTAEITVSCDTVEFGDLLRPYEEYLGPDVVEARPLPRYGEGSGGAEGQIVMSPGFHENLSANQVVYIDLGTRQDIRPGDQFTIFREIGRSEGITRTPQDKVVKDRNDGYESDRFHGGEYSIQKTRIPLAQVMRDRPALPRKVLGELVVLKVEKSASVAIITRTTAEVQIGDRVERSN